MDDIPSQPNVTIQSLDTSVMPQIGTAAFTGEPSLPTPPPINQLPPAPAEEALPPDPAEKVSYADARIEEIEVAKIAPNPFQPRKLFEAAALKELANTSRSMALSSRWWLPKPRRL